MSIQLRYDFLEITMDKVIIVISFSNLEPGGGGGGGGTWVFRGVYTFVIKIKKYP